MTENDELTAVARSVIDWWDGNGTPPAELANLADYLLSLTAAVLADRDRRMKAEAIRGAITALRQGAENLSLGDDVVSYLRGAERAATEHADREGGRADD